MSKIALASATSDSMPADSETITDDSEENWESSESFGSPSPDSSPEFSSTMEESFVDNSLLSQESEPKRGLVKLASSHSSSVLQQS